MHNAEILVGEKIKPKIVQCGWVCDSQGCETDRNTTCVVSQQAALHQRGDYSAAMHTKHRGEGRSAPIDFALQDIKTYQWL